MTFLWSPSPGAVDEATFTGERDGIKLKKVSTKTPNTQLTFDGLLPGTTYAFGVEVMISEGSETKRGATITTRRQITRPETPSWTDAPTESTRAGVLTLRWKRLSSFGNWEDIVLYYKDESGNDFADKTLGKDQTEDELTALQPGRFYSHV